ncbi:MULTISPECIES: DUF7344 domain-containing protein [Salinibaculum]|uniref:DUF7344 domain-containing protein n=1 Tax=Salinibaculum TaxID=2732368 RepID=UPI0030CC3C1E
MEGDRWGDRFRALANPYRRQLLVALLEHNPQRDDDVDPLDHVTAAEADAEQFRATLTHVHLPKLAELGYIDWDRETGNINRGPNWDAAASLLQLIRDHRDELPDGWR